MLEEQEEKKPILDEDEEMALDTALKNVKKQKNNISLEKLNLNNFNTSNVEDMSGMFCYCSSLKELNINNFNTDNVTKMNCMFWDCPLLKELNLNNFNNNKVTNMSCMFLDVQD